MGTKQVLCGWRDDQGVVDRLQLFKVRDLPKSAVEWKANTCANFLSSFLTLLKSRVSTEDLRSIHRVTWDPWSGVQMTQCSVGPGEHFLPDWYTQGVFK